MAEHSVVKVHARKKKKKTHAEHSLVKVQAHMQSVRANQHQMKMDAEREASAPPSVPHTWSTMQPGQQILLSHSACNLVGLKHMRARVGVVGGLLPLSLACNFAGPKHMQALGVAGLGAGGAGAQTRGAASAGQAEPFG